MPKFEEVNGKVDCFGALMKAESTTFCLTMKMEKNEGIYKLGKRVLSSSVPYDFMNKIGTYI